jgi:hypothetical protein
MIPRYLTGVNGLVLPSRPHALTNPSRRNWHGTPIELGDLFRLQKNRREARAALFTHHSGGRCACSSAHSSKSCRRRFVGIRRRCCGGRGVEGGDDRERETMIAAIVAVSSGSVVELS